MPALVAARDDRHVLLIPDSAKCVRIDPKVESLGRREEKKKHLRAGLSQC